MNDQKPNLLASDWNMQTINSQELEQHLDCSIAAGSNVVLIGRRGLGKTSITRQRILSNNMFELYINLSMFERADLMGYAKLFNQSDKDDDFIDYKLPRILKPLFLGEKKVVILFDEADKADSSLNAPLLEIIQDHKINGRELPNLQSCILTGNLISEGGNKLIEPLLDRAEKYLLEANPDIWLKWAAKSNIHASIYAFIKDNPDLLCSPNEINENYSSESPRGWDLSSKIITFGENAGWSKDIILQKIASFVGKKAAIQYSNYYEHYQVLLPVVDKIFEGSNVKSEYNKMEPSHQLMTTIIVASRFISKLDKCNPKDKEPEIIKYVGKFMDFAGDENVMAVVRGQITSKRIAAWKLHLNEHWKVINKILEENSSSGENNV